MPRQGGSRAIAGCSSAGIRNRVALRMEGTFVRASLDGAPPARGRNEVHPEDLMKPDLFSEILVLGSGGLIFVSLFLIVVTAFTQG